MKRKIALFTAIVMCAVFMFASVPAFAEEETGIRKVGTSAIIEDFNDDDKKVV